MQSEKGDNYSSSSSPLDKLRGLLSRIFGRKDPSNDPPATQPSSEPVIVELQHDDEEKEGDVNGSIPLVEHPDDDQSNEDPTNGTIIRRDTAHKAKAKENGGQAQTEGVSYKRVTYGGINGAYYTATTTRRTGKDGMVFEDSKQADITTGEATHKISRGIHNKGHSLTRKLDSDGKVNTMQTLHNLDEDELAGFEQTWKGTADEHLPGWNSGFDFQANAGTSNQSLANWNPEFRDPFVFLRPNRYTQPEPSRGSPKKVVTINIE